MNRGGLGTKSLPSFEPRRKSSKSRSTHKNRASSPSARTSSPSSSYSVSSSTSAYRMSQTTVKPHGNKILYSSTIGSPSSPVSTMHSPSHEKTSLFSNHPNMIRSQAQRIPLRAFPGRRSEEEDGIDEKNRGGERERERESERIRGGRGRGLGETTDELSDISSEEEWSEGSEYDPDPGFDRRLEHPTVDNLLAWEKSGLSIDEEKVSRVVSLSFCRICVCFLSHSLSLFLPLFHFHLPIPFIPFLSPFLSLSPFLFLSPTHHSHTPSLTTAHPRVSPRWRSNR